MKNYENQPDEIVEGATLRRAFSGSVIKNIDKDKRQIEFIISTAATDRMSDIIEVNGWDLKNYKANPVVLFGHMSSIPPIGKAIKTWKAGAELRSIAEFMPQDISAFAHSIFRMYEEGFLRAVSVGFKPTKWERILDEAGEETWGVRFLKQELLEFSAVPIPANPEALIAARQKGIDTSPVKQWAEEMLDNWNETSKPLNDLYQVDRKGMETIRRRAAGAGMSIKVPLDLQDQIRQRNLESIRASKAAKDKAKSLEEVNVFGIDFELPNMKAGDAGSVVVSQDIVNGKKLYSIDKSDDKVIFAKELLQEDNTPLSAELRDGADGKQDLILTIKGSNVVVEYDLVGVNDAGDVFGIKINEQEVPVSEALKKELEDEKLKSAETKADDEVEDDEDDAKSDDGDEDDDEDTKAGDDDAEDDEDAKSDDDAEDDDTKAEDEPEGDDDEDEKAADEDDEDDEDEKAAEPVKVKASKKPAAKVKDLAAELSVLETTLCAFEDSIGDAKAATRHTERKAAFLASYMRELADKLDGGMKSEEQTKSTKKPSVKKGVTEEEEEQTFNADEARVYVKNLADSIQPMLTQLITEKVNKLKGRLD